MYLTMDRPWDALDCECNWTRHDGGRSEAGRKGMASDCVTRAIAIVTGQQYASVYDTINRLAGRTVARTGVPKPITRKAMLHYGLVWTPTMLIGQGTTVHLRADELPEGRLIASVSKHVVAVLDGSVYDTHDPCRGGTRAVYGYWTLTPGQRQG